MKELSDANGGDAGQIAIVGRGSYEIALLSAGGAMTAVDSVMDGNVQIVLFIRGLMVRMITELLPVETIIFL